MPRKKKDAKSTGPNNPIKDELRELSQETDMMDSVLKKHRKQLEELKKIRAEKELLLNDVPEDDGSDGEENHPGGYMFNGRPSRRPAYDRSPDGQIERAAAFEATLAEFTSSDGKVEIYRQKPDGKYAQVGSFPAKEWGDSLEAVAKKFGGGTFKVTLRDPNGQIAGETVKAFDEETYPKPVPASINSGGINQLEMMRMLQEREERNQDKFMGLMTALISSITGAQAQKHSMINSMQDLATYKSLFESKEKPKEPVEQLETLLNIYQMGKSEGANSSVGEDGSIVGLLTQLLSGGGMGKLTDALKAGMTPARQNPLKLSTAPAVSGPAQPLPGAPEKTPEIKAQEAEPEMNFATKIAIKTYRPILAGYAQANEPPKKVAEMIAARIAGINDGWLFIIDDALKVPTTKEDWVYHFAPELRQFDGWVSAVMLELRNCIAEYAQAEIQEPSEDEDGEMGLSKPPVESDSETSKDLQNDMEGK